MSADGDAPQPRVGPRAVYVRRVTGDHVGSRVSVRALVDDRAVGPRPTDVVGRLLAMDDELMLIVDRHGQLHTVDTAQVLASRVIPANPRLPAEPDVGTEAAPLYRPAARVLLLSPADQVLLTAHLPGDGRRVWTAPGGGVDRDERFEDTARRELAEELGIEVEISRWVFSRRVTFAFRGVWIDQDERWFLARTGHLDPRDFVGGDPATGQTRWWTLQQLRSTDDQLAPATLADHVETLLRDGEPSSPIPMGR